MQNAQEFMGNVPTLLKPGKEELRNLTEVIVHQPAPQERVGKMVEEFKNSGANRHRTLVLSLHEEIPQSPPECFTKSRYTQD